MLGAIAILWSLWASPMGVTLVGLSLPEHVADSGKAHCARLFPDDYVTQRYCREKNAEGAEKLIALRVRHQGDQQMDRAIQRCLDLFTEDAWIDYATAAYCAEQQEQALADLRR